MTTWKEAEKYLSSLWLLDRDDDRPLDFHGAFVPAVAEGLILRHTQPGDWIWDPMAGSGTTGLVAERLGHRCFMSDLSPIDMRIMQGDARTIKVMPLGPGEIHAIPAVHRDAAKLPHFQFDLVILHPPYHDIIRFSNKPEDLANCGNVAAFYAALREVARNVNRHLKPGGYVGLVIGDVWQTGIGQVIPLSFGSLQAVRTEIDRSRLKAIVVKDIKNNQARSGQRNLWSARYFKWGAVHFAHEYIFSVQKGR